jgi:hypothetical protein
MVFAAGNNGLGVLRSTDSGQTCSSEESKFFAQEVLPEQPLAKTA